MPDVQIIQGLLKPVEGGVELEIHVRPRAKYTFLALEGGALVFQTTKPPVGGRANASLVRYLSKLLEVPRSRITIVGGVTSRVKTLRVEAPAQDVAEKLAEVLTRGEG